MLYRLTVILILMLGTGSVTFAQKVSGTVVDGENREPAPFANVWLKETLQGTMTDIHGRFTILSPSNDTLCVSSVGYVPQEIPIDMYADNEFDILLQQDVKTLGEVTVKPEIPRAKVLFNEIQKHKKENSEQVYRVGDYKALETTTVYMAVDTTSRIVRSFGNVDEVTVEIDNQHLRFSPVYLSEQGRAVTHGSVRIAYHKKDGIFPRINQTLESVIINNVVVDMDFYKDQIMIMDRGFISPLNNSALSHYNLYLNDSTLSDSTWYFHFSFAPKNKYDPLFTGHFTVEDGSFALVSIDAFISRHANLNFVNGFSGRISYKKQPGGGWFYDGQNIGVNLSVTLNKDSLSNYSSKRMDNVSKGNWLINKSIQYSTSPRLNDISAAAWKNQPEFASGKLEANAYSRVDKLKEHKVVKGIDKIGGMVLTSYFNVGKIDIGPVFDIYNTNSIEGQRFSIPLRTSEQMFERFSIGGFLGYGTKNNDLKYGMNVVYQPQLTDKLILRLSYSNDYIPVSQDKYLRFIKNNPNNKGSGNFIAMFTGREKNPYLKEEKRYEFRLEYNAPNGNHLEFSPYLLSNTSTPDVRFIRGEKEYGNYKNYGILMDLRLAFGQHYDKFFFDRIYYINRIPVVHLSWDVGQTLLPGQGLNDLGLYSQFHGSIQGRLTIGQLFMNYIVNAGYLFGGAPYDLLDQPVGSMSLGYSKDRFNLLHFAAFAHNLYSNTHLHVNGGGVLLNRVPLVKKLKLREIVSLKCHYGTLTDSYKGVFDLPGYYSNKSKDPYAEIGIGVTNIFKVLRVEYVHQLGNTYMDRDFTDNSGIFFRTEMSF
ncbi:MAG: DUF5686 family protein [Mangrovibacterium sp.]